MSPSVGIPSTRLEESKAELIARAVEVGDRGRGSDAQADSIFLQRYFKHVAPEDIVGRDPVDVFGAALANRELAQHRPQGRANVRVYTPTVDEHGWASGHTVVEVVTDDMPFLVDSVTSCLGPARHLDPPGDPPAARCAAGHHRRAAGGPGRQAGAPRRRACRSGHRLRGRRHRVVDARRDRPGERRGRAGPAHRGAAPGPVGRPRGGRGLAQDARRRAAVRRGDRRAPRRRCPTRRSPRPGS